MIYPIWNIIEDNPYGCHASRYSIIIPLVKSTSKIKKRKKKSELNKFSIRYKLNLQLKKQLLPNR